MTVDEYRAIEAEYYEKKSNMDSLGERLDAIPMDKRVLAKLPGNESLLTIEEKQVIEDYEKSMDDLAPVMDAYLNALQQPVLFEKK